MSLDGTDAISNLNKEALYNAKTEDFHGNEIKFFGDYDFIPVPENKSIKIKESIESINKLMYPTVKNLSLVQNYLDIQDRVYNRMMWYTDDANKCIKESRNVKEVNVCTDVYISRLNNQLKSEVIEILKDY